MRYFMLAEAERLLPTIERHLRDALFHKAEYQHAHQEIEAKLQHIRDSGGARIDSGKQLELRNKHDASVRALQASMDQIAEAGALVKDLDIGLLDFMTRYKSQDVCLCWRLGEQGIHYWHSETEGFGGRKLIDEEFLQNHGVTDGQASN
jgi:hypothetical protein